MRWPPFRLEDIPQKTRDALKGALIPALLVALVATMAAAEHVIAGYNAYMDGLRR